MYPSDSSNTQPKQDGKHTAQKIKCTSTKKVVNRPDRYSHSFYSDSYYDDLIDEEYDEYDR